MGKLKVILLVLIIIILGSCQKNDKVSHKDEKVIVDKELYNTTITDIYSVVDARIDGDILKLNISSGGCDGNSWSVKLVDSGDIAESLPVQRFLKIVLKNEEECLAIVTKEFSFNISKLRIDGSQINFNLKNHEKQLLYTY